MSQRRLAALEAAIAAAVNAGDLARVEALRDEWREVYAVEQAVGE